MTDSVPPDRATFTLVVHRLTYAELWRLANHHWFKFLILLGIKLTKSPRLDHTTTSAFAAELLTDATVPVLLHDRFTSARAQYDELGFRYLGMDAEMLRGGGCTAHFVRGPVLAMQVILPRLNYASFYSFPPDRRPLATANGRAYIDNSVLYEPLLVPKARIRDLLTRHLSRIAPPALPDLTDADVRHHLEQIARRARAHQIARGVFVPQPLIPPLLPKGESR